MAKPIWGLHATSLIGFTSFTNETADGLITTQSSMLSSPDFLAHVPATSAVLIIAPPARSRNLDFSSVDGGMLSSPMHTQGIRIEFRRPPNLRNRSRLRPDKPILGYAYNIMTRMA
eukprot:5489123-Pyramimonas_sp.AAC.1